MQAWLTSHGCFQNASPLTAVQSFAMVTWGNWDLQIQLVSAQQYRAAHAALPLLLARLATADGAPCPYRCVPSLQSNYVHRKSFLQLLRIGEWSTFIKGCATIPHRIVNQNHSELCDGCGQESEMKWRRMERVPWLRRWINLKVSTQYDSSCC
jgi:hypothetical protein